MDSFQVESAWNRAIQDQPLRRRSSSKPWPAAQCALCDKKDRSSQTSNMDSGLMSFSTGSCVYQPLDENGKEIRLLSLQPGKPSSPIVCILQTFSLTLSPQAPDFEALSYEWGPAPKFGDIPSEKMIFFSKFGSDIQHSYPMRENLFLALQHLRSPIEPLLLWIDAICIDQNNIRERNHQVGLMRMVYSRARRVHVWLGPHDDAHSRPFDLLNQIAEKVRWIQDQSQRVKEEEEIWRMKEEKRLEKGAKRPMLRITKSFSMLKGPILSPLRKRARTTGEKPEPSRYGMLGSDLQTTSTQDTSMDPGDAIANLCGDGSSGATWVSGLQKREIWYDLHALLTRSYWKRIWIVQEFVLARDLMLYCGSRKVSWDDFATGLEQIRFFKPEKYFGSEKYWNSDESVFDAVSEDVRKVNESAGAKITLMRGKAVAGGHHRLLELFELTRESRCCDPRDRVFALLGLASDVEEDSIVVDYTKSAVSVQNDVMRFLRSQPHGQGRSHDLTYLSSLLIGMLHKYERFDGMRSVFLGDSPY